MERNKCGLKIAILWFFIFYSSVYINIFITEEKHILQTQKQPTDNHLKEQTKEASHMQSESSSEESAGSWETNQVGRGSKQSGKLQLRSKSG